MLQTTPELVRPGQLELRFFVDPAQSAGSMTAFELVIPPQARVPVAHHHLEVDELFLVTEGTVTYTVDGERFEMHAGERRFVPRGAVHHFANEHDTLAAQAIVVLTPGKIGPAFFREAADVVNAGGPPDPARMREVMLRHGLVPAV
jgi:quercetin dioxygenase-like cupin family protein